jgi:hypothetical protein
MNNLDIELKNELLKKNPRKEYIMELVKKGADVNISLDDEYYFNYFRELLYPIESNKNSNIDFIKYFLDNGLDINHINPDTGYNYLLEACQAERPDVFELLLQYGANPNCISTTYEDMTLSCEIDQEFNFYTMDMQYSVAENYKKCNEILTKYGGKCFFHLKKVKKIKNYIIVYSKYKTGIVTWDGLLNIKDITKNKKIKKIFYKWIKFKYDEYEEINISTFAEYIKNGKRHFA